MMWVTATWLVTTWGTVPLCQGFYIAGQWSMCGQNTPTDGGLQYIHQLIVASKVQYKFADDDDDEDDDNNDAISGGGGDGAHNKHDSSSDDGGRDSDFNPAASDDDDDYSKPAAPRFVSSLSVLHFSLCLLICRVSSVSVLYRVVQKNRTKLMTP